MNWRCSLPDDHDGACRYVPVDDWQAGHPSAPPLYSGPRCPSCGGDHFPQEPTTEHVIKTETRLISDAVARSPVLHQFVTRIRLHAQHHRAPDECETCFAWAEYHRQTVRAAKRPEPGDMPEADTDTTPTPNGPQGPPTAATEPHSTIEYWTPMGLRRWLRRNQ